MSLLVWLMVVFGWCNMGTLSIIAEEQLEKYIKQGAGFFSHIQPKCPKCGNKEGLTRLLVDDGGYGILIVGNCRKCGYELNISKINEVSIK